jgi:hypothetical protein
MMEYAGAVIVGILVICALYSHFGDIAKMKKWDFDWYRGEFPKLVSNRGVQCYKCNGSNIGTERLMGQTYMRAHICRQCGTKLYYSNE